MWQFLANIPPKILYISFAFIAATELYLFLVQRSALEIARTGSLDARTSRYMLPLWYALHWPIQIMKWLALFLILITAGWIPAMLCLAIPFLVSLVVPIPHRHFIPMFRHRLSRDLITGENPEITTNLQMVLDLAAKHLEIK